MTFMGGFSNGLIAHELAHQWFGDKVTCGSWTDIWLNEGFATYLTGLTVEHFDGNAAFTSWRDSKISSITSEPGGSVYCTDTTSVWRIFNGRLSYNKGSMVLHMLRYKLGDENFFQGLRNYLADPQLSYGYASTEDLKQHLEAQSGLDLDEFFNDWFMGEGYPSYQIHWNQTGNNVQIKINQTQSHPSVSYFEMPVPVKLVGSGGNSLTLRLENTFDGQIFNETVNFTVNQVLFDPESHLISNDNNVSIGVTEADKPRIVPLPNPVSGKVTIHTVTGVKYEGISVYNEIGQKIGEQDATHPEINFETLPSGLILLRIHTDKGDIVEKLINK
jgi:aminopeptidase N